MSVPFREDDRPAAPPGGEAREVGGTDLGRLLSTLSGFLRDDARTRAELLARQSWSVNAGHR